MSNCTPPVNDPPLKLPALYEGREREQTLPTAPRGTDRKKNQTT